MAWVSGEDVSTGELITAAQWNNYMGASGSLEYLKGQTDRLDGLSHDEPLRAMDTIYQNTSGKNLFVAVSLSIDGDAAEQATAQIGSGTPPGITVADLKLGTTATSAAMRVSCTFIVQPGWYYRVVSDSGSPWLLEWHEWEL